MAWNRFNSLLKNFSLKIRNQCFLGRHFTTGGPFFTIPNSSTIQFAPPCFLSIFFCNFYNGTLCWNSLFSLMSLVVQDSNPLLQIRIGKLHKSKELTKNYGRISYISVAMCQIISQSITQKLHHLTYSLWNKFKS